ncbi:MAG: intradiol ring-cleavage dioxygenase [Deltaproteobacteria bacterium]|nr:intradiol ring-cleavage dioxygenase [Deltaproteobacteria bacterium]
MNRESHLYLTRREFFTASLALPAGLLLMPAYAREALAQSRELEPTPACADADDVTPPQTAGPFYKPRSPERQSLLEPNIRGSRIVLQGYVRSRRCQPVPQALVDFWHADATGAYDNAGYRLRGHQFTDRAGRYRLETIVPGIYPGRTRHFHVRVQAPNRPVLTTQLYFPGEAENRRDSIFNAKLVMALRDSAGGKSANFDFVLDLA